MTRFQTITVNHYLTSDKVTVILGTLFDGRWEMKQTIDKTFIHKMTVFIEQTISPCFVKSKTR